MNADRRHPALTALLALLLPWLLTSCASPDGGAGASPQTLARVEAVARLSGYVGAKGAILQGHAVEMRLVADGLTALVAEERWDLAAVSRLAVAHGLGPVLTEEGRLAFDGVPLLLDAFAANVDLRQKELPRVFILGLESGVRMAVGGARAGPERMRAADLDFVRLREAAIATRPPTRP